MLLPQHHMLWSLRSAHEKTQPARTSVLDGGAVGTTGGANDVDTVERKAIACASAGRTGGV
jgi:hypothetical protein